MTATAPAMTVGESGKVQSKYETECGGLQKAAFECLERHLGDRTKCGDFFREYRNCRREEHRRLLVGRGGRRFS